MLQKKLEQPTSKYLVFSSVGDRSNLSRWLGDQQNFDLWVCYYGEGPDAFLDVSDYYLRRQGGKFPNLHHAYQHWPELLNSYQAVLVMDDDILIDVKSINRLFSIHDDFDLAVAQPAFSSAGKISHPITKVDPACFLRYTNFVEVTCPLFKQAALSEFMRVYDPALVGWGVDYWFIDFLHKNNFGEIAIIDGIFCINPGDWEKGGVREIDSLQIAKNRMATWQRIQNEKGILVRNHCEYDRIRSSMYCRLITAMALFILRKKSKIRRYRFEQRLSELAKSAQREHYETT